MNGRCRIGFWGTLGLGLDHCVAKKQIKSKRAKRENDEKTMKKRLLCRL